ncbi:hypothetical protein BG011_002875, partial [Mortierella polycephala]
MSNYQRLSSLAAEYAWIYPVVLRHTVSVPDVLHDETFRNNPRSLEVLFKGSAVSGSTGTFTPNIV